MTESPEADRTNVLIIDDEVGLADLYAAWLSREYEVRTAYSGTEGLEKVDDDTDVVLLDRRMPDLCGDRVLEAIRDREHDCYVSLISAIEPDFDIIDVGFDEYLIKPASQNDLRDGIERLLALEGYDESVRELYAHVRTRILLEHRKTATELVENSEYRQLRKDIHRLTERADDFASQLGDEDFDTLLRRLGQEVGK